MASCTVMLCPAATIVDANDAAVLALQTWHKPLDPHAYDSALQGDLALPMVGRGQLLGLLLCGERAGGEAYAPVEIDALAQFAQGVGSAFDGLGNGAPAEHDALLQAIRDLRTSIDRHFAEE
jgi:GAF domain-containing protein